jgi:hypothetical protein
MGKNFFTYLYYESYEKREKEGLVNRAVLCFGLINDLSKNLKIYIDLLP